MEEVLGKLAMRQRLLMPSLSTSQDHLNGCLRCTAPGLASEQDRKAVILGLCQGSEEVEQVQDSCSLGRILDV